jgi:hypothetical protein
VSFGKSARTPESESVELFGRYRHEAYAAATSAGTIKKLKAPTLHAKTRLGRPLLTASPVVPGGRLTTTFRESLRARLDQEPRLLSRQSVDVAAV